MTMTDEELVAAFESTELPGDQFTHAAHVRVAWCYLRRSSTAEALARFDLGLRRFAAANGAAGKYHATITTAFMLVIAERLEDARDLTWAEFAARHPELLTNHPSILARYYRADTLTSDRARRVFVMPDRLPAED